MAGPTLVFDVQILDHPLYNIGTWKKRRAEQRDSGCSSIDIQHITTPFLLIDVKKKIYDNKNIKKKTISSPFSHLPSESQCIAIPPRIACRGCLIAHPLPNFLL